MFDKCQKRLEANKQKPAHFKKVEDKYILTGKIFCGLCGNSMIGVSGTSKTGTKHRYYYCHNAKSKKSCNKKRIKKDLLENIVLISTLEMLKDKKLIKQIVNTCYKMQSDTSSVLNSMENRLKQIEKEIGNMIAAIKQGIITESTKTELSSLEAEKNDLQTSIAREQMKHPVLTKEQIEFWICRFQNTDITDQIQKQKLIDVFINSVYVYEDNIIITFNYKDGEKSIDFSDIEKIEKKKNSDNPNDYQSSPLKVIGGPSGTRTPDHPVMSREL